MDQHSKIEENGDEISEFTDDAEIHKIHGDETVDWKLKSILLDGTNPSHRFSTPVP